MTILLVGGDDVCRSAAMRLFRAGHLPVGLVVPPAFARRLLCRCDAVLWVGEPSPEADALAESARWEGKTFYRVIDEVPPADLRQHAPELSAVGS